MEKIQWFGLSLTYEDNPRVIWPSWIKKEKWEVQLDMESNQLVFKDVKLIILDQYH